MRTVRTEFNFDDTGRFLALLARLPGFVDSSWGNDTCPSMTHEAAKLIVWFDFADYDMRELGSHCQFTVVHGEAGDTTECLLETNDVETVVLYVLRYLESHSHDKPTIC